jgi:calpain
MSYTSHDFVEGQNYDQIKAACLKSQTLFEDDSFQADDSSIYRIENFVKAKYPNVNVQWKRPHEFLPNNNPEFIVDSVVPEDIDQGKLGDWKVQIH